MKKLKFTILFITLIISASISAPALYSQDLWEQTNGPFGGSVHSFAKDSSSGILCGTLDGGIFRTTDNGQSWSYFGLTGKWVEAIAIHPNGRIFAASNGLYMSTDNGSSWSEVITSGNYFTSIVINSSGHIFASGTGTGVFRSTNNGTDWTPVNNGLGSFGIFEMSINNDDDLYIATDYLPGSAVYRSTDNGNNWISIGPPSTFGVSIMVTEEDNILLGTVPFGIYLSTNDGATWDIVNAGMPADFFPHTFSQAPGGEIYVGTSEGVFSTGNKGGSWASAGGLVTDVPGLYAEIDNLIFAGSSLIGALRSDNGGGSWQTVNNGLINEFVWAMDVSASNTLYAGGKGGFYKSSNSGGTWQLSNYTFTFEIVSIYVTQSGSVFIGTRDGVYRSNDNGDTWVYVKEDDYQYNTITESQNGNIFIGNLARQIYRSTNNGDNWTRADDGIPDVITSPINSIASRSAGELYAGTGTGIYRSTNNGDNWTQTSYTTSNIHSIVFNQSGDIFAGGTGPGILKSTDNGNTWTPINTGVTNIIYELEFNSVGTLFAASDKGVFKSTNDGNSWTQYGDDLAGTRINSLAINSNDFIFGGSSGNGVYKSILPTGIITANTNEIPSAFSLRQNYPNPFNPTTNIKFEVQSLTHIELKVYDIQGREVAGLVNKELQAGVYEFAFDGSGLSSGIYFYTLTAGNFKDTKRMILLK